MENRYRHVRQRPGMYGLHGNYFYRIFEQSLRDLLHEYSFARLKITTDPNRNQVVFEASERNGSRNGKEDECWSFILIAGICSTARFSAEDQDGAFRRTIIRESAELENSFGFRPDPNVKQLECGFVLPEEFPIDENFVRSKVHQFSKIFPHSRILCNGREYAGGDTRNRITWFLNLGRRHDLAPHIYEFSGGGDGLSWEVSFEFTPDEPKTFSFINGIATARGGTHVDGVESAIRQAFRKAGEMRDPMRLAVSIHLPPGTAVYFDTCRCGENDLRLISEHPEFHLLEQDLEAQIAKYLSEHPHGVTGEKK